MNRKIYASILVALMCLALGFLAGCSSSSSTPPPPPTIVITPVAADATQSTTVGTAFANPMGVTVTSNGSADSGATVTFAATTSLGGATCALSATSATTDANGSITSVTCTANGTAGSYTVTATVSGASSPATFNLTNNPPTATTANFVFYASGTEVINGGPNYYAMAGVVTINTQTFAVTGGEMDYNDGAGITETAVPITGGAATISQTTGTGTLTLVTADTLFGSPAGTITLSVAFANGNHAVINQFDGTATSSGSMDLQTATNATGGGMGYAFTLSGVDWNYYQIACGGVFALANATQTGVADVNDGDAGTATSGNSLSGTSTQPDSSGRGTAAVTVGGTTLNLAYYVVGPEVMRLIDVDAGGTSGAGNAMIGSAYGQGTTTTFSNASLTNSVFGVAASPWWLNAYAASGMIVPTAAAGTFTGVADDNENGGPDVASAIGGTYSISNTVGGTLYNGYGSLAVTSGSFYSANYGIYMTDPALNLVDPNSTTEVGGALLLNLDPSTVATSVITTTGVLVPQTDTTNSFSGVYAFGTQDFYGSGAEIDYLGEATVASEAFTATGLLNDPFGVVTGTPTTYASAAYAGTVVPDTPADGRYAINPLVITPVSGTTGNFAMAIYQADANLLFWVDETDTSVGLGTIEAQSAAAKGALLKGRPVAKAAAKAPAKLKR